MCSEIRLISLKLAQCFVRRKLQLFTSGGTGAPRPSLRFFFRPEATDLQLYITVPEIIPTGLDGYSWMYRHDLRHRYAYTCIFKHFHNRIYSESRVTCLPNIFYNRRVAIKRRQNSNSNVFSYYFLKFWPVVKQNSCWVCLKLFKSGGLLTS